MSVTVERRTRLRVEGTVQGVGFRPYVYRLAGELGLAGFVLNDSRGVLIEIEGDDTVVDRFVVRLRDEAPPLAVIDRVLGEEREPIGHTGFQIVESPSGGVAGAAVTPDTATCGDCLQRAARSARPPPPLPVHQLHQLRPAVHDRPPGAL